MNAEPSSELRAARRMAERNGSAVLRAVGREPTAEIRSHRLEVGERPMPVATPYLVDDGGGEILRRGTVDALAVRLRFSDTTLHVEQEPSDVVARIVFDTLEQIRCESLVSDELLGVRHNIEQAFRAWCSRQELSESALGLLVYTVLHMARSRLVHPLQNEAIEDTIEQTRARISPMIGTDLKALKAARFDQRAYAVHAGSIAAAVASLITIADETGPDMANRVVATLFVPPEWGMDDDSGDEHRPSIAPGPTHRSERAALDEIGGYRVYTRSFDRVTEAALLYPEETRRGLRLVLDEQVAAQSVSVFTIARRLQRLFLGHDDDGWSVGEEEGILDAARLTQIVANPANRSVFRQQRSRPVSPVVVSFLIDNSGSMKRQRYEAVAVLVDTLARALDLAGATSEILGFTTCSWNGGEPLRAWRRNGEPSSPGRIAETHHIVYKDADTPWKRSRLAVAALMKTQHFREGVDGEAIAWAHQRLVDRPEPRKLLVVIGDGAPMEAATMNANGETFLEDHLRGVAQAIEHGSGVALGAIAVDQPVDAYFSRWVGMDLTGTLTLASYRLLEDLFARAGSSRH